MNRLYRLSLRYSLAAILALGGLVLPTALQGQTYPFPRNVTYAAGTQQTWESAVAAGTRSNSWYTNWRTAYLTNCSGTEARIDNGSGQTYSEGIGYGMLVTAYAGDKANFDKLWTYYRNRRNGNGLMNWCISGCGTGTCGNNGATDGDLDAALALVVAEAQWPSAVSPYDYGAEATTLITAIRNFEMYGTCSGLNVTRPGDAFNIAGACNCLNPSYYSPGYYRVFANHVPSQAAFWNKAADDVYTLINNNANATTGLVSAWQRTDGSVPGNGGGAPDYCNYAATGGGGPGDYQFDACRTPWRIAIDYLWFGTPAAGTWLTKVANWSNGVGVSNIVASYTTAGSPLVSYKNSAFTGGFALAQMATGNQTRVNTWYQGWSQGSSLSGGALLDDAPYFQRSLGVMYHMLATGNFWCPLCTPPVTCLTPNMGPDLSICGGSTTFPVTLNSNTPTASGVTFTWRKIAGTGTTPFNIVTNNAGANTRSISGTGNGGGIGTYVVIRDSTGGCSRSDTIVISGTLPTPTLGSDVALCDPAYTTLSASNSASFPVGTTWAWTRDATAIEEAPASPSLTYVAIPGTYRLTASISGCPDTYDEAIVTSSLPTPVPAYGTFSYTPTVSITGFTPPASNYRWFGTEANCTANTSQLGTGSSYNPGSPVASQRYYWVKDGSSVSSTVGPNNFTSGLTQWGVNTDNGVIFTPTANFQITSLRIPFEMYNAGNAQITVAVRNSSGTVVNSYQSDVTTGIGTGNPVFVTFNFTANPINVSTTNGTNQRLTFNTTNGLVWSAGGNGNPLWNNGGGGYAYPYTIPGTVSLTGSISSSVINTSKYGYFQHWTVQAGSGCTCLPVGVFSGTPLPVEFASFTGKIVGDNAELTWITAQEEDNDFFEVQRSLDGVNFSTVGYVDGSGTTSSAMTYQFSDASLSEGVIYYRIKQVDFDGAFDYSNIISLRSSTQLGLVAYPNPFDQSTTLLVEGGSDQFVTLTITDMTGRIRLVTKAQTGDQVSLGAELPSGFYIVEATGQQQTAKLRVLKTQ